MPRLTSLRPMLAVTDLPRTIAFYRDLLGFELLGTFGDPPVWAELQRDGVSMMFNSPPKDDVVRDVPRRAKDYQVYYINTDDVAELHAQLLLRGVAVSPLRVAIYQMKEFELRDPDHHWLWFGQPTSEPPTRAE